LRKRPKLTNLHLLDVCRYQWWRWMGNLTD
jgi:hypothetical protein